MSHYYPKDEFSLPSVTKIIKDCTDKSDVLMPWAVKVAIDWIKKNTAEDIEKARFQYKELSKKALDIGSETHNKIQHHLNTGKTPVIQNEQTKAAYTAFLDFKTKYTLRPVLLEKAVYSKCWAGTLDYYGYVNDKLYVLDWKTSKGIYPGYREQVAAYRYALGFYTNGCGVVRLDKTTGHFEFKDTTKSYEKDLEVFKAMVKLFFLRHPRIAKNAGWKK